MITLIIIAAIIGGIASAFTGIGMLLWLVGALVFICGLPFALISSFVHGEVSYGQDRADYRQEMAEINAEELADEQEFAQDARVDRLVEAIKRKQRPSIDNRQIHIHGRIT
jgi:hypothetical protein